MEERIIKINKDDNDDKISMENVKSKYIIQEIFSFLSEKIKLDIVKYNKKIQKKIGIKLLNYKFFSGKYIIYEENGRGKEYEGSTDNLIYEGEYLIGKRNGKGKDYINGFEGEYLNGKMWNGKVYDKKNNIIYEVINGNGHIKEYNSFGQIIFDGEYMNGKKNGKCKEYYYFNTNTVIFEGEYLDGLKYGKAKEYDKYNNLIFEGEYFKGKKWNGKHYDGQNNIVSEIKEGNGNIKTFDNKGKLIFECSYLNGEENGIRKEYFPDGKLYFEGNYLNGKKNGKCKMYNGDMLRFEGEYLYDYKLTGKEYINNKSIYEGEYLYNKKWNGKGYDEKRNASYIINNGNGKVIEYHDYYFTLKFEGEYLNGKRSGYGKEYNYDGYIIFEGEYLNGEKSGKGKEYLINTIFEGEYLKGKKNGKGKIYKIGKLIFEGEYLNGKKMEKEKIIIMLVN